MEREKKKTTVQKHKLKVLCCHSLEQEFKAQHTEQLTLQQDTSVTWLLLYSTQNR